MSENSFLILFQVRNTLTYNRVAQQHLQFTGCLIKQFNKKYMYHVVRGTGQGDLELKSCSGLICVLVFHMSALWFVK